MFQVNDDMSIYVTRGDMVYLRITAENDGKSYTFEPGEVLRFKVFGKKDAENVVLQKDFPVTESTSFVDIILDGEDTKIGEVISKPRDYWYEVELNPFDEPITIIGYDEDGAKVFKLFPEGADIDEYIPDEEDIPPVFIDDEFDMSSPRPVQNQVVARAFANLQAGYQATHDAVATLHVTPEMYGAVGDGVADDTDALTRAMGQQAKVTLNGVYRISSRVMCSCSEIEGNNSTLIADLTAAENEDVLRFADAKNVKISNLTIDGNNGNMRYGICILNAENVTLDNITVFNVRDMNNVTLSNLIALYDCVNVSAKRIYVHKCYKLGDGVVDDGGGALYGFYSTGYERIVLENSRFEEIHNINSAGNFILEDAAAIYVKTISKTANTLIENVSGINTGKRFIKSQNAGTVKIDSINFVNTCNDFLVGVATMWSADTNQTTPATTTIINSHLENDNGDKAVGSYLIGANDNVIVSDCVLNAKSGSVLIFTMDDHIKSDFIKFANCEIVGNLLYTYTSMNNIAFNNCHIKTSCLMYKANLDCDGEFIKFSDCRIDISNDYYDTYSTFAYNVGRLVFNNCDVIDSSSVPFEVKDCDKLIINNCYITLARLNYPFYVYNDVELSNTKIINEGSASGRLIQMKNTNAHVYIKNIEDVNMEFVVFSDAHYHIGENVNIGKLATYPGVIEKCVPSYNDNISAYNLYNIADGAMYIDTNDGLLYRVNKSANSWVKVG